MRKVLLLSLAIFLSLLGTSQNIVFFDNFENGLSNWNLTGTWGLSTNSFTGIYSMSESPAGNYPDQTTMTATMDSSVDLTSVLDAEILFSGTYHIEFGFDFMYLEATSDGGNTWVVLESFSGDSAWYKYVISLGGFVGSNNVKCRFRFFSDPNLNFDGMDIDDFLIMTYTEDNTAPLIVHYPLPHYEGSLYEHQVLTEIIDVSGISFATLTYRIDNVLQPGVSGINYSGDTWLFEIPPAPAGSWIKYKITAQDSSINSNTGSTDDFEYIAGNYIKYDNGIVDFVGTISPFSTFETGASVKINLNDTTTLVSALVRNYIDFNNPNADMEFHVWAVDTAGLPGADLITPFIVVPTANAAQPHKMTRIDLRSFGDTLQGISGDVFVGFRAPFGDVHVGQTTPAVGNHTYIETFNGWTQSSDDYHFRAVTSEIGSAPTAVFTYDTLADPLVSFTDQSLNNPTSWHWDFDDGGTFSNDQHPEHAFTLNGTYNVCLTVDNGITSNTTCQFVSVQNVQSPTADFYYITTYSPEILFVDTSYNYPTSWFWDFDDNGATWGYINPIYTFTHNDTFHVCLTVQNLMGGDTLCQDIIIDDYIAPDAAFSFDPSLSPWIQFYDESSNQIYNTPDGWYWDFDNSGAFSNDTNVLYLFPENGVYNVCLTSTNTYGSDTYCNQVVINSYLPPVAEFNFSVFDGPVIQFNDQSSDSLINETTNWEWDFDDGSPVNNSQSPQHTFPQNGSYEVCLVASNTEGTDTIC
ncbi:MAG: PKD domain-containing protein, partial [Bacteroidota bacterium]|nr:PKD domain-containing protein [Bacteroidota bacterium]